MDGTHDNDNDALPFISLAAATAGLISKFNKQQSSDEKRNADRDAAKAAEQEAERKRQYVEQRLREIAAFERRARGH